jgi:hypothetical protein
VVSRRSVHARWILEPYLISSISATGNSLRRRTHLDSALVSEELETCWGCSDKHRLSCLFVLARGELKGRLEGLSERHVCSKVGRLERN